MFRRLCLDAFETFCHDAGAGLGKGAIPMRGGAADAARKAAEDARMRAVEAARRKRA
jgi:hypothetical protein